VLLSMTGFGQSRREGDDLAVDVEVRTVNNRYLKINTKFPDGYGVLEGEIERIVRAAVSRGTVTIAVRVGRIKREERPGIDFETAAGYWRDLMRLAETLHAPPPPDTTALLVLPGVLQENEARTPDVDRDRPLFEGAVGEALERLQEFRRTEGDSMLADLRGNGAVIAEQLNAVAARAPEVVANHRERILVRIGEYLEAHDVEAKPADLIREVALFADRCDVNEEITRLRSHLEQFEAFLSAPESQGRKLDFLSQEMFREVNTIGSKANNVEIAHHVVEMKAAVERIREVLANVE
jgi:uncharacterized protein (TIGR00255 family)